MRSVPTLFTDQLAAKENELQDLKENLDSALQSVAQQRHQAEKQAYISQQWQDTVQGVTSIFHDFLTDHVGKSFNILSTASTANVHQLFNDYLPEDLAGKDSAPINYLRISEIAHQRQKDSLEDAYETANRWQSIAREQQEIIQDYSTKLDSQVEKWQAAANEVEKQNLQILKLGSENAAYKVEVMEYEQGLRMSESARDEHLTLQKQNDDLMDKLAAIETEICRTANEKDLEIANLRTKLARVYQVARISKEDMKAVTLRTDPATTANLGGLNTYERLMGKSVTKASMTASKSMLTLGLSSTTHGKGEMASSPLTIAMPTSPRPKLEAKSAGRSTLKRKQSLPSMCGDYNPPPQLQPRTDSLSVRPRKDSLTAISPMEGRLESRYYSSMPETYGSISDDASLNGKNLPPTPEHGFSSPDSSPDRSHFPMPPQHAPPQVPRHETGTPTSPRGIAEPSRERRVLSGITERSEHSTVIAVDGSPRSTDADRHSLGASSSDKEFYRRSMDPMSLMDMLYESVARNVQHLDASSTTGWVPQQQ